MSIATIVPENAVIGQAVNIRSMETDIVSLDDRLLQAFFWFGDCHGCG